MCASSELAVWVGLGVWEVWWVGYSTVLLLLYSCTLMGRWGGFDVFWLCVYIYYITTELVDVVVVAWNQHKTHQHARISIEPSSWPLCPPHTLIYTGSYMKLDKVRCYVRFRSVKKYYNSLSALLVCCLLPAAVLLWLLAFVWLTHHHTIPQDDVRI